jgi:hypothetical protein
MRVQKPRRYAVIDNCYLAFEHGVAIQISYRGVGYWIKRDAVIQWIPADQQGPDIVVKHGGIKTIQGLQSLARQSTALNARPGEPGTLELTYGVAENLGLLKIPGVRVAGVDAKPEKPLKTEEKSEKKKGLISWVLKS